MNLPPIRPACPGRAAVVSVSLAIALFATAAVRLGRWYAWEPVELSLPQLGIMRGAYGEFVRDAPPGAAAYDGRRVALSGVALGAPPTPTDESAPWRQGADFRLSWGVHEWGPTGIWCRWPSGAAGRGPRLLEPCRVVGRLHVFRRPNPGYPRDPHPGREVLAFLLELERVEQEPEAAPGAPSRLPTPPAVWGRADTAAVTVLAMTAATGAAWRWQHRRHTPRRSRGLCDLCGLCVRCGYDLRGNANGVCPECGVSVVKEAL